MRTVTGIHVILEQLAQYGTPPPDSAKVIDIGSDGFLAFFEKEILENIVFRGASTCRFYEGSYGSGKTHLLQLLEDLARRRGMAVVKLDLSQNLRLDDWQLVTRSVLENIHLESQGSTVRGLPDVLNQIGRLGNSDRERLAAAHLPHAGFQIAMERALDQQALNPEGARLLARYLRGEQIGTGVLSRSGVKGVKAPLSQRNAEQVLNTVLGGIFQLGVPGTMLLLDENERTFSGSGGIRVSQSANLMRRFIDACFSGGLLGTVAVFAVLPGFVEAATLRYPALGQRLRAPRVSGYDEDWRWPVISTELVTGEHGPELFLEAAITKMVELTGARSDGAEVMEAAMREQGTAVLQRNAGSGYRRELMKALASVACSFEKGE